MLWNSCKNPIRESHGIPHLQIKTRKKFQKSLKICTTSSTLKKSKPKLRNYGTLSQISGTLKKVGN
jgi:hypothetical protein